MKGILGKMKIKEYIDIATSLNQPFSTAVLKSEAEKLGVDEQDIIKRTENILADMRRSLVPQKDRPKRCEMAGHSAEQYSNSEFHGRLLSPVMADAASMALQIAQNSAGMGRIVAAPTAGACGILPGVLLSIQKHEKVTDKQLVEALINASGVGIVIAETASISGASGGCQAEIGSASAMAASAVTELLGGNARMCGNAMAFALKFIMGLVCDPVAGLVVCPCIKRNGSGAVNALFAAELALSGVESMIPPDEVIIAMKQVGDSMSISLKETALGGLAVTPTGKNFAKRLSEITKEHEAKFFASQD